MRCWAKVVFFSWMLAVPFDVFAQEDNKGGLSLNEAIATVLVKSPMSEMAEAGMMAAEHGRKSARGEFLAKVKTSFSGTVLNETPVSKFGSLTFSAGSDLSYKAQATLEQPIFTGLALLSQYRLAELGEDTAEVRSSDIRQELILLTFEAYYGVLLAEKYLEVAEQAVTQLESHAEVSRQFFENGMIPKNDLLKTLVSLADVKQQQIKTVHDLELAHTRLNALMRREAGAEPLTLSETLSWRPYEKALEECLGVSLGHHPSILLADLDIRKGDQAVVAARSGFFPKVGIAGAMVHEEGGFTDNDMLLSATLWAEWAIWEWGSNYHKVRENEAYRLSARAQQAQQIDYVEFQVRQAYLALKEQEESIEVARASIEQAEENYRITVEQYKENITTSTEVLDAQQLQAQARVNYYNAQAFYNVAIARLEKAMGILEPPGTIEE